MIPSAMIVRAVRIRLRRAPASAWWLRAWDALVDLCWPPARRYTRRGVFVLAINDNIYLKIPLGACWRRREAIGIQLETPIWLWRKDAFQARIEGAAIPASVEVTAYLDGEAMTSQEAT